MGVKQYKPTSPGRRFQTVSDFAEITTDKPEKSLLAPLHKKAGRNNKGRVTTRARQGRYHRVRPQPFRPYCSAALRGR